MSLKGGKKGDKAPVGKAKPATKAELKRRIRVKRLKNPIYLRPEPQHISDKRRRPSAKLKILDDFEAYISQWSITCKDGSTVKFELNAAQRIVLMVILALEAAGRPVRIKILKGRQLGISLLITAWIQHRLQTRPGSMALSMADKSTLPAQWVRRAQTWHEQTYEAIRPELAASNALELFWNTIGCRFFIGCDGGKTPGMGERLSVVHMSELSNWLRYAKISSDLKPSVPTLPGTAIFLESTGETEGDEWHKQVMLTLAGDDDYELVFLPWFIDAGYQMEFKLAGVPRGFSASDYTPEERDFCRVADKWAIDNPEYAEIAAYTGITPEQMAWRRHTIRNSFSGDLAQFKSRNPAEIHEAFLGAGSMALPVKMVSHHKSTVQDPIHRVQFERDHTGKAILVPFEGEGPPDIWPPHWRIWEERREMCEYAIGADVAVGKLVDKKNLRGGRDSSVIAVLNRRDLTQVAEYSGKVQTDVFGEQMVMAGEYYNNAWIAPEVNNPGLSVLNTIKNARYINVMYRASLPDQVADRDLSLMGWLTSGASRELMISDWIMACRQEYSAGYEGKIVVKSEALAREEQTFVITALGKKEHRSGCHDDHLFAWMIALQVHKRCSHDRADGAEASVEPEPIDACYSGGVDTWAARVMAAQREEMDEE